MENVTIALIQSRSLKSKSENLESTLNKIIIAASNGAKIICLQELFLTDYFCQAQDTQNFSLSESIPGPTTNEICQLAKKLGVVIILPLFEFLEPGIYYNTAAVIDADGTLLGIYRKTHIPQDPGFEEKFYFTPGDLGYQTWKTKFGKIGVLICWDQWFPEAARLTALKGADIIFYPTAIGKLTHENETTLKKQLHAWQTIQKSHAIANGCYIACVNRVGNEEGIDFWGQSFVSNFYGETIGCASTDDEETLIVDCNLKAINEFRQTWPFYRDRRIDTYSELNNSYTNCDTQNFNVN